MFKQAPLPPVTESKIHQLKFLVLIAAFILPCTWWTFLFPLNTFFVPSTQHLVQPSQQLACTSQLRSCIEYTLPWVSQNHSLYLINYQGGIQIGKDNPETIEDYGLLPLIIKENLIPNVFDTKALSIKMFNTDQIGNGGRPKFYRLSHTEAIKYYQRNLYLQRGISIVTTIVFAVLSLVLLVFSFFERRDPAYFWLGVTFLLAAPYCLLLYYQPEFLSTIASRNLLLLLMGAAGCTSIMINQYLLETPQKLAHKLLLIYVVAGGAIYGLTLYQVPSIILEVWLSVFLGFSIYGFFHIFISYHIKAKPIIFMLLFGDVIVISSWQHDFLGHINFFTNDTPQLLPINLLWVTPFFLAVIFHRLYRSMSSLRIMNGNLETIIDCKQKEIETQYENLKISENEKLLSRERERIMKDMHDGIGGQIVSLTALLRKNTQTESNEAISKAQNILQDFRAVIDSLEPDNNELDTLLSGLRFRLEDILSPFEIELVWEFSNNNHLVLSPSQALNLIRIIQEVIQNSIKHAKATQITLSTTSNASGVTIQITDNGKGFNTHKATKGKGSNSMRMRALEMNWGHTIHSNSQGTRVILHIPTFETGNM